MRRIHLENSERKEVTTVCKWMKIFLALIALAVFYLGCTGVSKDTKVRCPKCGAVFTVDEGLREHQSKGP